MKKNYIKRLIIKLREKQYLKSVMSKNTNQNPTIISNNCIAGVIYHNLGLKFYSPTINLFFKPAEYIEFIKNLKYYSTCDVVEVEDNDHPFPVGKIVAKDNNHMDIYLYFQHYKDFSTARDKWLERYARINYDNIYYIMEFYHTTYDNSLMKEFDQFDQGKKHILITHKKFENIKNSAIVTCYDENEKPLGKLLQFDGLTGKRFLEEFDYVSFIN